MEATIPRSLPVITGLPWSCGSRDCSHEAKNASPSICRMARGKACSVSGGSAMSVFPHSGDDDRSDMELVHRIHGLVLFIRRFQPDFPASFAKRLHRPAL